MRVGGPRWRSRCVLLIALTLASAMVPAGGASAQLWPDSRSLPIYSAASATAAVRAAFAANPVVAVPDDSASTAVFLAPHQDDETLSFGAVIEAAAYSGHGLWLVDYAAGDGTDVCRSVEGVCTNASSGWAGRPLADFVAARDAEQTHAAAELGVPAGRISRDPFRDGTPRTSDGAVTLGTAALVLARWHAAYPSATFWAMSWVDLNAEHALMGEVLRAAVSEGLVATTRARFVMATAYQHQVPPVTGFSGWVPTFADLVRVERGAPAAPRLVACSTNRCRGRVAAAVDAYRVPTGIGWMSVNAYMRAVLADPDRRVLTHDAATSSYAGRTDVRVARAPTGLLAVTGRCVVRSYLPLDRALRLAAGEASQSTLAVWPRGYVLLAYVGPDGSRTFVRRPVTASGRFSTELPVVAGTVLRARCTGLAHVVVSTGLVTSVP